jgi:hypothetical protein
MSLFDNLQTAVFGTVNTVMADVAVWTPSTGGSAITAKVLFNDPTGKEEISQQEYDAAKPSIEYLDGTFTGLFELVSGNKRESITINGHQFKAIKAEKKYDGKTIIIHLNHST